MERRFGPDYDPLLINQSSNPDEAQPRVVQSLPDYVYEQMKTRRKDGDIADELVDKGYPPDYAAELVGKVRQEYPALRAQEKQWQKAFRRAERGRWWITLLSGIVTCALGIGVFLFAVLIEIGAWAKLGTSHGVCGNGRSIGRYGPGVEGPLPRPPVVVTDDRLGTSIRHQPENMVRIVGYLKSGYLLGNPPLHIAIKNPPLSP